MRVTVTLTPGVYDFVYAYARAKGLSTSAAINELVRRAESVPESGSGRLRMNEHGYFEIAATGDVLTAEIVKEASEDALF